MFVESQDKCIVMSSVVENFGLHLPTREKREKGVCKNQIPLRKLSDWKVFIVGYMFMESQDKSIVMSSPIRLSKILVYIRLHEKNGKKTFSKIGFHSGELSDWKVFIVGYMFVESQDKSIVMSSPIRLSKILVYIRLHEKNGKKTFSKIGFHSGELSDWKVFTVGYMFMESQDKCTVMSSVVEKFQQT